MKADQQTAKYFQYIDLLFISGIKTNTNVQSQGRQNHS